MEISLLADHPQASEQIARWYYDEWTSKKLNASLEKVRADIASRAINREQPPLSFIAHVDGRFIGVAELKLRENPDYPDYEHWLGGLFVCPEKRGNGYGGALITSTLEHASRFGITTLYLQCREQHVSLYRKYGFEILHSTESAVIMSRHKDSTNNISGMISDA